MVPNLPQPMAFEGSAGKQSWNLRGNILGLGIILAPSILSREIAAKTFWHHRHFGTIGTIDILACLPFSHANISKHGHLILWMFRYGNIYALWTSWYKYFDISRRCSSSELFLHCYLPSWLFLPWTFQPKFVIFKRLECQKVCMKLFQWT